MLPCASKATKEINSYRYVPIPSAREMFTRYGECQNKGVFLASHDSKDNIPYLPSSSVIDGCINAQMIVERRLAEGTIHQNV